MQRIVDFFRDLGVEGAESAAASITECYAGADRHYHTMRHIADGLDRLPEFSRELEDERAFVLGWLFHDAVYDSRRYDNEEQSAMLLVRRCAEWGVDEATIEKARRFVLATKHGVAAPQTSDERHLVDLDMSILGASDAAYDRYEGAVRKEYGWLTDSQWALGRAAFLSNLRAPYFSTEFFVQRFSAQVERNIKRSLEFFRSRG
jgi:predicted metal-dependent HD superfamily phosphohydrolase